MAKKEEIQTVLNAAGINVTGFCAFETVQERLLPCRAAVRLPKNTQTVICCAFPYKIEDKKAENISRYAAVKDYHIIVKQQLEKAARELKKLFPENEFEPFCDNSPIPEVFAAACAGIGVRGDNGLLITENYGSWVFLGEIVTDLAVCTQNQYKECLHCGKCKEACPKERYKVDCLSKVSQKKGELSESEAVALKDENILWGCDICAEVCPLNKTAKSTYIPEFKESYRVCYQEGENTDERAYMWRGEAVIKRNYKNLTE